MKKKRKGEKKQKSCKVLTLGTSCCCCCCCCQYCWAMRSMWQGMLSSDRCVRNVYPVLSSSAVEWLEPCDSFKFGMRMKLSKWSLWCAELRKVVRECSRCLKQFILLVVLYCCRVSYCVAAAALSRLLALLPVGFFCCRIALSDKVCNVLSYDFISAGKQCLYCPSTTLSSISSALSIAPSRLPSICSLHSLRKFLASDFATYE